MTSEEHYRLYEIYSADAKNALRIFIETGDRDYFDIYRDLEKEANKHHGIASRMLTIRMKKYAQGT